MAKIDDFRAALTGGGARGSQFRVDLTFPTQIVVPGASDARNKAKFLVKSATLPASTITAIDVPFRGRIAKVAGERQFMNWNMTVINDNDFAIRKAFEAWSQQILNHGDTNGILEPNNYISDMEVVQLDRKGDIAVQKYKFHNCYPVNISDIRLDFGDTNSIEEYNVELSVDYWTIESDGII